MENIDLTQTVTSSVPNLLGAGGILIVSAIFILMFIFFKRYKSKVVPLFMGILSYIVFGFLGYNILVVLVLNIPGINNVYESNQTTVTVLFTIISVIMYSAARIVLGKLLCGKYEGPGDVLNAGLGLGMCEALMYGFSVVMMITWCAAIQTSGLETIFSEFSPEEALSTYNDISMLLTAPSVLWILLGISYVMNIVMNVGLTMVNYGVAAGKIPKTWYGISMLMNFIIVLPFDIYDSNSLTQIVTMFVIKSAAFLVSMYIIYQANVKYLDKMLSYDGKAGISKASMPKFGKLKKK